MELPSNGETGRQLILDSVAGPINHFVEFVLFAKGRELQKHRTENNNKKQMLISSRF